MMTKCHLRTFIVVADTESTLLAESVGPKAFDGRRANAVLDES